VALRGLLVSLTAVTAIIAAGGPTPVDAATLFATLGGEPVLRNTVDQFAEIVEADPRIDFTFADTDMTKFKQLLFEQLCELTKGPCRYTGRDMHTAHAKLKITTAEFNALAEDLYLAMGKAGVPYRQQNKVMALLAPMKRDIVKPPSATP
jgi:hemoglobin